MDSYGPYYNELHLCCSYPRLIHFCPTGMPRFSPEEVLKRDVLTVQWRNQRGRIPTKEEVPWADGERIPTKVDLRRCKSRAAGGGVVISGGGDDDSRSNEKDARAGVGTFAETRARGSGSYDRKEARGGRDRMLSGYSASSSEADGRKSKNPGSRAASKNASAKKHSAKKDHEVVFVSKAGQAERKQT